MVHPICRDTTKAFLLSCQKSAQIKCMYGAMPMCWTLSLLTQHNQSLKVDHYLHYWMILLFFSASHTKGWVFERARTSDTETRWWANDAALRKVFGSFAYPDNSLYVDVILTLTAIQDQLTMKTSARISAHGFIEALLKYETVFTAQIFLRIFEQTSPLSKYLQTEGIDILYAYRMVRTTHECLSSMSRDFVSIKAAADRFAQWTNEKL